MHIDSFITYLKTERRYSSYTLRAYEKDLLQYFDFLGQSGQEQSTGDKEHRQIRQWIVSMMEKGLSPRSVRRKASSLGSYYNYLVKKGIYTVSPLHKVTLPKTGKRLPGFIPEEKLNNLLDDFPFGDDFTGTRNRLIIELLYFTGMRRSELIWLTNSDVNTKDMTIKVSGKGNKQRIIPVGRSFLPALQGYTIVKAAEFGPALPEDPFFVTGSYKKVYPELVYRIVKKYISLVTPGRGRSPHLLRHSFATHMLDHGASLNSIKELLGHESLAATQVYTHNSLDKLKKIYKQAHPRA
jgi:integrase/recombinase XerC